MTVRRRRSDRSGRSKLHSPGRPDSARREELVRFWAAIATGRSSEDAARDAGVSPPVGSRWFRRSGGMPPSHLSQSAKPLSGRYLSFEEREEIALLRAQGRGIRHIACRLERAPSTISREVRRNAATRFLETKLKLKINTAKSASARPWQRAFLGFSFTSGKQPKRRIAPYSVVRFKRRVRELTRRTRGVSLERRVEDLAVYLNGWHGYFGFCETPSTLRSLDQWVRRRLRAVVWQQWRRGPKRYAELRRRDVGHVLAAQTAGSACGPWRLSNSPALSIAMSNAFFSQLGLPSLVPQPTA